MAPPPTRPQPSKAVGTLLIVLGVVIMVATGIACMAYGVAQMQGLDPLQKAELKSNVRLIGTPPMLAGVGLVAWGIAKRKRAK